MHILFGAFRAATALCLMIAVLAIAGCGGGGGSDDGPAAVLEAAEVRNGQILLDARQSRVPAGRSIQGFHWRLDAAPQSSELYPSIGESFEMDADAAGVEVAIDFPGEYGFSVRVFDGQSYSEWTSVSVVVAPSQLAAPPPPSPPPPAPSPPQGPPPTPPGSSLPDDPQPSAKVAELGFGFVDSDIDRIGQRVLVLGDDRRLYIHDMQNGTGRFVTLPKPGNSIAVSPWGHHAVVSHDALVTHVDLATGQVVGTYPVATNVGDIAYGSDGRVHAFPGTTGGWRPFVTLDLATGTTVESQGHLYGGDKVRMHPSGRYLYTVTSGLSPADLSKFDLQAATPRLLYDSPYHGDYAMCGDLWISSDGGRIFTACGTVFHSSESQATDMRYAGSLGLQTSGLAGLDSSTASDRVVTLHANEWRSPGNSTADQAVQHYDYRFLQPTGQQPLPTYDHAGGRDRLHGRAVWMSQDASRYFVIATPTDGHLVGYRAAILEYAF